jgi:hypothetical protein
MTPNLTMEMLFPKVDPYARRELKVDPTAWGPLVFDPRDHGMDSQGRIRKG